MKSNMLERLALFVSAGLILVITASGSLLMSGQASAEEASQGIEEVVVTARRREKQRRQYRFRSTLYHRNIRR